MPSNGERTLKVTRDFDLLPMPNVVRLVLSAEPPPVELTTSAAVFAFHEDEVLLVNLAERGWDIPGGHIEQGESPEQAVRRETVEEAGTELDEVLLLGHTHVHLSGPVPSDYKYPDPDAYLTLYWARIAAFGQFAGNVESLEARLFSPSEALALENLRRSPEFLEEALRLAGLA
jgi:8-oxo-dGTP pyrophosphatase MutT (NUDIX family)